MLRPIWKNVFKFNWKFGFALILLICIPRFLLVLNANATKNYGYIGLIMIISGLAPFVFLNNEGLKKIGIVKPKSYRWLLYGFLIGLAFSILLFFFLETSFTEILTLTGIITLVGHTIYLLVSVERTRPLCF